MLDSNVEFRKERQGMPRIIKHLLLFFFVFDAHFAGLGLPTFFTTKRIVALLIICWAFATGRWPKKLSLGSGKKAYRAFAILVAFVFFYATILRIGIGAGQGIHIFNNILVFVLTGLLSAIAFLCLFDDFDELMKSMIWICIAQVVIIILFAMLPSLQIEIDRFLGVEEMNADYRLRGYMTGFACSTSRGVLRLTTGLIGCVYFLLKDRKHTGKYIFYFATIGVVATILGRTGLFVSGIGILFICLSSAKRDFTAFVKIISALATLIILAIAIVQGFGLSDAVNELFARLLKLFDLGLYEGFFKSYFGQAEGSATVVPPLSIETMIGIGVTSGVSGNGITVNVDGGYARLYAALGLPVAIAFYLTLFVLMAKSIRAIKDVKVKTTMLFMFVYIFAIGEVKEYFVLEGYSLSLFFGLILLHDRENERKFCSERIEVVQKH